MYKVNLQLHDASMSLLDGDAAVLVPGPQLREPGGHEIRQVVLDYSSAGYLDWGEICDYWFMRLCLISAITMIITKSKEIFN